jgi:hypothetical protein
MSDIKFVCPECSGHLTVEERGAGLSVPCSLCRKTIVIPKLLHPDAPTLPLPKDPELDKKFDSILACISNHEVIVSESIHEHFNVTVHVLNILGAVRVDCSRALCKDGRTQVVDHFQMPDGSKVMARYYRSEEEGLDFARDVFSKMGVKI